MKDVRAKLLGTWRLISYESRISGKETAYPFGEDAVGQLTYDSTGRMSAQLMKSQRPRSLSVNLSIGSEEEITAVGYLTYFGTFEVEEDKGMVTHHVEGALFPKWIGTKLRRLFELSEERLTLKTPPISFKGEEIVSVLVWEKIK